MKDASVVIDKTKRRIELHKILSEPCSALEGAKGVAGAVANVSKLISIGAERLTYPARLIVGLAGAMTMAWLISGVHVIISIGIFPFLINYLFKQKQVNTFAYLKQIFYKFNRLVF